MLTELSEATVTWFANRGISRNTLESLGVWTSVSDRGDEAAVFQFFRSVQGARKIVNRKYRSLTDKRFWSDKGGEQILFNLPAIYDEWLADQPLIITEGEIDALTAVECGFPRAVSIPGGALDEPVDPKQEGSKFEFLFEPVKRIRMAKKIILAMDDDKPGRIMFQELNIRIGKPTRTYFLRYPPGCKDLNDVLRRHGRDAVIACIDGAQPVEWEGRALRKMSDFPKLDKRTPIVAKRLFGERFKLVPGLVVVTGIPGHGKTTFVNDLCCSLWIDHGFRTVFASFEQQPNGAHKEALAEWFFDGPHQSEADIAKFETFLDDAFLFAYPNDDQTPDIDWVTGNIEEAVRDHGCKIAVIDPWNELEHNYDRRAVSLTEYIGQSLQKLRKLAEELGIVLIVVAHPRKLQRGSIPTLYDISESANWANKAVMGMTVYRDRKEGVTKLIVLKTRWEKLQGEAGVLGYIFRDGRYEQTPLSAKQMEFDE